MDEWFENKLYVSGPCLNLKQFEDDIQQQTKQMFVKPKDPNNRSYGTCKFFDEDRGFGFIKCEYYADHQLEPDYHHGDNYGSDDTRNDIFVHCSELQCGVGGARVLEEREFVMFEIVVQRDGRKKAVNVTGPKGRYISGPHNFMPFQRNPDLEEFMYIEGNYPIGLDIQSINNINGHGKSIVIKFSTKSNPPLSWLTCIALKYYQLSFKLRFESDLSESQKTFGCIMYEKGRHIQNRSISFSDIWKTYKSELKLFVLKEWQNVYCIPIRTALARCQIQDDLQTVILSFLHMSIQSVHELVSVQRKQFMVNWKYYKQHKIEEHKNKDNQKKNQIEILTAKKAKISEEMQNIKNNLRALNLSEKRINQSQTPLMEEIQIIEHQILKLNNCNIKSTENKPRRRLCHYFHIPPFPDPDLSDFSDFFDNIQHKIECIFCKEDIEILHYPKRKDEYDLRPRYDNYFWGSLFPEILHELDIYIEHDMEPFIVKCAKNGDIESVRKHIENGYDLDRRRKWTETDVKIWGERSFHWFGDSALMIAAKNGYHEMVKELLMAGADPMLVSMGNGCNDDESYDALKVAKNASKVNGLERFNYIVSILEAVNALWKKLDPRRYEQPHFSTEKERKYIPKLTDIKKVIDSFPIELV